MKQPKIKIVLLSVDDFSNGRKVADNIEGTTYKNAQEAFKDILSREEDLTSENTGVAIFEPTEFMEECNDQILNLEKFWVSYIFLKE